MEVSEAIKRIGGLVRQLPNVAYPAQLPAVEANEDLAVLFASRLDLLRAPGDVSPSVLFVEDLASAMSATRELCSGVASDQIIVEGQCNIAMRDFVIGITSAEALIAETGSVFIPLASAEAAYPSLLVDRHIVLASHDKILQNINTWYERLSSNNPKDGLANYVCITGCSRTADIEKMLVIPAHGPRQVRVILSRQSIDNAELGNELSKIVC